MARWTISKGLRDEVMQLAAELTIRRQALLLKADPPAWTAPHKMQQVREVEEE